jgi:hypothetical protein
MAVAERDIIQLLCKELFTVRFIHSAYGVLRKTFISEDIFIEPDRATRTLFTNHSVDYRFINDTLVCYIRTEVSSPPVSGPRTPFIKFDSPVVIRFLVSASIDFLDRTNVIAAGAQQTYYFTNKANAATGGFICMHSAGVNNDDLKDNGTVDPEKSCFAVIDIASAGAVNTSYEIFTGGPAQQLTSPGYAIQFISTV